MGNNASRNETDNVRSRRKHLGNSSSSKCPPNCEQTICQQNKEQVSALVHPEVSSAVGSAAVEVVRHQQKQSQHDQQRSRQHSMWSLGSLSGRINWSLSGAAKNSFHNRNKTNFRKSFNAVQQKRSKTRWHRPLTNTIFSSHFSTNNRNEELHIERLIEKGAFGVVFKVAIDPEQERTQHNNNYSNYSKQTDVYALKVLRKSKLIEENCVQQTKDEAEIQKLCGHHPFIVQQIDRWQNRHYLYLLSEYIPNGELFAKILTFSVDLIRLYIAEIALAIDFLHNAGIIYRDVKPENILLTETYHIKLTDFGLSKWLKLGSTTGTICGTFKYMAPEILRGESYGHAVDWWSLGIIACQMFTDRQPDISKWISATKITRQNNDVTDEKMLLKTIIQPDTPSSAAANFLPIEVASLTHAAKDLIQRLLEFDSKKRLRSVLSLQRIAFYQDFKIDAKHLLSISPLYIINAQNIKLATATNLNVTEASSTGATTKAFECF